MTWNKHLDPTHPDQGTDELCSDLHDKWVWRSEAIETGSGKSSLPQADVENVVGGAHSIVNLDEEFQYGGEAVKQAGIAPTLIEHPKTHPLLGPDILTQYHAEIIKPRFALSGGVKSASDALRNLLQDLLDKATLTLGAKLGVWISLTF